MCNAELKNGDWQMLYIDDMKCLELREIVVAYGLENEIVERIMFQFKTDVWWKLW